MEGVGISRQVAFCGNEKKQIILANNLSESLGGNVESKREKNECFDTGQGPYDNGYLWCQTSTIFMLANDIDPKDIGTEFLRLGGTVGSGHEATGYELPLYFTELTEGPKCHLGIRTSSGVEVNGARRNPFDSNVAKPMVAVTCGDRAKAEHY